MSFLNKIIRSRNKTTSNKDIYSGLRYPASLGDIEPGIATLLNFNVVESVAQTYNRDRSTTFGDDAKYVKTIQLYMPAIQETLQNNYNEDKIGFIGNILGGESMLESGVVAAVGAAEQGIRNMMGPGAQAAMGSKSTAQTSTVFYESTSTREMSFTYSFEPKSMTDVKNVNEIVKTFRKYLLPEINGDISYFPKFWAIEETDYGLYKNDSQHQRDLKLFKFGPAALLSVNTNLTPDQIWRTFESGDPLHIILTLTFREIFILSQADIDQGF